jgi:hypothetical protein
MLFASSSTAEPLAVIDLVAQLERVRQALRRQAFQQGLDRAEFLRGLAHDGCSCPEDVKTTSMPLAARVTGSAVFAGNC